MKGDDFQLTESEWRHRLISEVIADYIFLVAIGPEGNPVLEWASDNQYSETGRGLAEMRDPADWSRIIYQEDLRLYEAFMKEMLTTREKGEMVCRSVRHQETVRWLRISARQKRDPGGRLTHIIGAVRDVTTEKETELKLKKSEEKYRKLHSSMTDAFCSVDMQGRLLEANDSYCGMLGYTREELMNRTYLDLTPEKWHAMEEKIVEEQILATGSSGVYEKEYIRKDGKIIPIELRTFLIRDEKGTPEAMWAIVRDITERRNTEEKLKTALEAKEVLLKEVHHRVKNNLQTVMTLIYLRSPEIRDETAQKFLSELVEQIRTISVVYSELYQNEMHSGVRMQPYAELLVSYLLKTSAASPAPKVIVSCGEIVLDADNAMPCGLIINELVTNSLKHAFTSGRETDARIMISLFIAGGTYTLRVADNGIGLPAGIDDVNPGSSGLKLVSFWAKSQMKGTFRIDGGPGASFTITFIAG